MAGQGSGGLGSQGSLGAPLSMGVNEAAGTWVGRIKLKAWCVWESVREEPKSGFRCGATP